MAKKEKMAEQATENQEVENQVVENAIDQDAPESPEVELTEEEKLAQYEAEEKAKFEAAEALAEELKGNVGRRCKVVPFNTITWMDGTIVGTIHDKRSNKVLYAIKIDDGRRIVKANDSELLQLLDETVEIVKNTRRGSVAKKMTEDEYNELEEKWANCVGHQVMYVPHKMDVKVEGKITSIVPDEKNRRVLLKIESVIEGEPKVSHKTCLASDIEVLDTDTDVELKTAFLKRREVRLAKLQLTPEQKIEAAEQAVKKAIENIEKAIKIREEREAELEKMKAEYVASQTEEATETSEDEDIS